jgi:hypothetical protein
MRHIEIRTTAFVATFFIAACARSVTVVTPPEGSSAPLPSDTVTFTVRFHARADVSTFRAFVDPPIGGGSTPIDVTANFSQPLTPGGQSTAVVVVPQTSCHLLRAGCVDDRLVSVQANMVSSQAFDSRGHSRDFRIHGSTMPPPPPPPPSPSFQFTVPVIDTAVHWGNSVAYALQLTSQNGFAGAVTVTPQNLPFGASAPPVTVNVPANGSATANLTVATMRGMTALGQQSFMVNATGTGAPARTRTLDLLVLPAADTFRTLNWRTASSSCAGLQANVQGGTVSFAGSGFTNTTGLLFIWYAFTSDCRGAAVFGPSVGLNQGNTIIVFNLGFPDEIAAARGSSRTLGAAAYDQTRFRMSADGSHLIAVSQSGASNHASLWNLLDLAQVNPPYPYTGTLSVRVAGRRVEATPSMGNAFFWELR